MSQVAVEHFFSVVVEKTDGKTSVLRVSGDSRGDAYKHVQQMDDVRRVGKITEIAEGAAHPSSGGSEPREARHPRSEHRETRPSAPAARTEAESSGSSSSARESLTAKTISGPRLVRAPRPAGGEQPFRHLKAAPGLKEPPPRPVPVAKVPVVVPAPVVAPAIEAESAEAFESVPLTAREYRIVKSRRREGHPYLLQRGSWSQLKGKRVFESDWEKGFQEREKAEHHQRWLEEVARETAELDE